jgi:formylglycine-generating enzyme
MHAISTRTLSIVCVAGVLACGSQQTTGGGGAGAATTTSTSNAGGGGPSPTGSGAGGRGTTSAAGGASASGGGGSTASGSGAAGGGGPGSGLSCQSGAPGAGSNCGDSASDDCCSSLLVPGGSFLRSYDGVTLTDDGNPATVSPFRLDTYEVTVGRYRAFVNAGMGIQANPPSTGAGAHPAIPGSGWDSSWNAKLAPDTTTLVTGIQCDDTYQVYTPSPGDNEHRAMNCLDWYMLFAFCIWDGGRLPTEAEWNYAAAGGGQQRVFPWSTPASDSSVAPADASYWVDDTNQCMGDGVAGCSFTDVLAVGTKPAGRARWGHADLGGNLWEWVFDWYVDPYPAGACNDCANLTVTPQRVVRGGGYFAESRFMRAGYREGYSPDPRDGGFGGRCARNP